MTIKTSRTSRNGMLSSETKELVRDFDEFLRVAGTPSPKKAARRAIVLRAGLIRTKGLTFDREEANERQAVS